MSGSNVCPPPLNTDVGGIGVRVSFYLQALFLACISAKLNSISATRPSEDLVYSEVVGSLYTLVGTNISMSIITFFLGFKSDPEITLNDAIVVLYLVGLSSIVILILTIKHWHDVHRCDGKLAYLSVVQYYLFFSLALAVFIKADNFGAQPDCNVDARMVIFTSIAILSTGRIISIVSMGFITGMYTWTMSKDLREMISTKFLFCLTRELPLKVVQSEPEVRADSDSEAVSNRTRVQQSEIQSDHNSDRIISGRNIIDLMFIVVLWALVVVNTELLIRTNRFEESEAMQWQFGQILALSLVIFPLKNMIEVYRKDSNREAERLKNEKESV